MHLCTKWGLWGLDFNLQKVLLTASMERGMITASSDTFNMACEYCIKKDLKKCEPILFICLYFPSAFMSQDQWCSPARINQDFYIKILPSAAWTPSFTSQYSPPHFSSLLASLALALYELLSPLWAACAVFLVSPSDCCFACSATADRYPALCDWWARRHRWNNNRSACLYRAVSQLVQGTQGTQCKTIIYNNKAGWEHQGGEAHSWEWVWE